MNSGQILRLRITEAVGSSICVSVADGARVHGIIADAFARGERVALSFAGVARLTTAFLNISIGQLYNEYSEEDIRAKFLAPEDATPEQLSLLKQVVDNAKIFFADKARINGIVTEVRGDG